MTWCATCFCWKDYQRGVVAVGVFSAATSMLQILVTIAVFTGSNAMAPISFAAGAKEGTTYELYIALSVMDFFMFIFALLVLYGNELSGDEQVRCYYWPWLLLLPFYIIYESAINIFYFYSQFNRMYTTGPLSMGYATGFNLVPLVYWIFKDMLLFIAFVFILVHVRGVIAPLYLGNQPDYVYGDSGPYFTGPPVPAPPVYAPAPRPALYIPTIPPALPPPPVVGVCSNNACGRGLRASTQVQVTQPLYGYAGPQVSGGASRPGWTTSIIQTGGR